MEQQSFNNRQLEYARNASAPMMEAARREATESMAKFCSLLALNEGLALNQVDAECQDRKLEREDQTSSIYRQTFDETRQTLMAGFEGAVA